MAKKTPPTSTDPLRLKAQQMREQQARKDRRTRNTIIGVVSVLVVAIVVAVVLVVANQRNRPSTDTLQSGQAAEVLGPFADGSPVVYSHLGLGKKDDSLPTLTEYFDYSCHVCANIDVLAGEQITEQAQKGAFNIAYQPVTTVGMAYQQAATTASLVVAQKDPEHWTTFHHALLAYFQSQYNNGIGTVIQDLDASATQVASIATQVGVPADVVSTFPKDAVDDYLKTTSAAWFSADINGRTKDASGNPEIGTPEFVNDALDGTRTYIPLSGSTAEDIMGVIMAGMGVAAK